MVKCQEYSLHHILNIDEGDILTLVSYSKVYMLLDALCHQEIVFLSRTIHAGRSQDDIGEVVADAVKIAFCLQLALAVCRVWSRHIILTDFLIRQLLTDGSEDAERTDEDKSLDRHPKMQDGIHQVFGSLCVNPIKVFCMQALGSAGCMHYIVELMRGEFFLQLFL